MSSLHSQVQKARDLAPMIAAAGETNDEIRELTRPVVRALIDGGLFSMLKARSVGGMELKPSVFGQGTETIAAASGEREPEGAELARLSPRYQATLFNAIRAGVGESGGDLRASAIALVNAKAQLTMMPPDAPPPTRDNDKRLAGAFEAKIERVALMFCSGIHDNPIVAVGKVSPHRPGNLADLFGLRPQDPRPIAFHPGAVPVGASGRAEITSPVRARHG